MSINSPTGFTPKLWLDADDLATELGIPKATLYKWRTEGKGPRGHKLGRHLRFSRENVDAWLAENIDPDNAA